MEVVYPQLSLLLEEVTQMKEQAALLGQMKRYFIDSLCHLISYLLGWLLHLPAAAMVHGAIINLHIGIQASLE